MYLYLYMYYEQYSRGNSLQLYNTLYLWLVFKREIPALL